MSVAEIGLILFVVIIFFGPEDLPRIARALGKMIRMYSNVKNEISQELKKAVDLDDAVQNNQDK